MVQDIRVRDDSETNSLQNEAVARVTGEVGQGEPAPGTEGGNLGQQGVSIINACVMPQVTKR